ncbi:ATP synthase F0 subcomplex A subunit [Jatrophihabitans sp. GAS493]|uniref:F0F1 ATP synthase subunit A n=1 Tax=Jatrophihabitans sp. GAS493 TaxID=1907575 RepID=UPI000BBF79F4|nr:F0F1 ATP synthase subunit A [Jatrophihabitans sp. GAS493]SOD73309.1 ATP synthase F0 subcomplex A subunit [Jatrophihabitans sp. GAS493]
MTQGSAYAEGFNAPGPADFDLNDIFNGHQVLLTKASLMLVLGAVLVVAAFLVAIRREAVVPSKAQFMGEQAYSFVRNGIAQDSIGNRDFMKYVPFLVSLFFFIMVNNLFGLIPFLQFSPFSRAGFAYGLAALVWITYNAVGIARHGFFGYLKLQTVPSGVPAWILPLLIPLEFFSNILVRPVTLALRLFANMFAGHLLLLLFATGGEYLLFHATGSIVLKPAGVLAFVLGIAVGFLELIVALLQAYVFTLLTAQYIGGALADSH